VVAIGALIAFRPFKGTKAVESPLIVVTVTATPIISNSHSTSHRDTSGDDHAHADARGIVYRGNAIVAGTGSALRLRSDPGLQSTTLKTVSDGGAF